MTDAPVDELLFTYGTFQRPDVQLDTFGRLVTGEPDWLPGYAIRGGRIRETGNRLDRVPGRVLHVTSDEVEAADEYQVERFRRDQVVLASGRRAWVFVTS